jgi:Tfp pilus assembly protein PilN
MTVTDAVKKFSVPAARLREALERAIRAAPRIFALSLADDRVGRTRAIVLCPGEAGLCIAAGSSLFSRIRVTAVRQQDRGEAPFPTPEEIASEAALFVKDLRMAGVPATLVLPKGWAIMMTAELPAATKDTLSDVVAWELDRLTPLSADRALWDFRVLDEQGVMLRLALAAVRTDRVEPYLRALRERGIEVNRVTVDLSTLATLSRYLQGGRKAAVIRIGSGGFDSTTVIDGVAAGVSAGSFAGKTGSPVEEVLREMERLAGQRAGDTEEPAAQTGHMAPVPPDEGSPGIFALIDAPGFEAIRERTTLPVTILNDADLRIRLPDGSAGIPCAAFGGLLESLWAGARGFNVLAKGREAKRRPPLTLTALLCVAIVLAGALWLLAPMQLEERRIAQLDQLIALQRDDVKKAEALKKEVDDLEGEIAAIRKFKQERPPSQDVLKELTVLLPKSAWLSRAYVGEKEMVIEGYAASASELLQRLEDSPLFQKVEFAQPTMKDTRTNAERFVIRMAPEAPKSPAGENVKNEGTK